MKDDILRFIVDIPPIVYTIWLMMVVSFIFDILIKKKEKKINKDTYMVYANIGMKIITLIASILLIGFSIFYLFNLLHRHAFGDYWYLWMLPTICGITSFIFYVQILIYKIAVKENKIIYRNSFGKVKEYNINDFISYTDDGNNGMFTTYYLETKENKKAVIFHKFDIGANFLLKDINNALRKKELQENKKNRKSKQTLAKGNNSHKNNEPRFIVKSSPTDWGVSIIMFFVIVLFIALGLIDESMGGYAIIGGFFMIVLLDSLFHIINKIYVYKDRMVYKRPFVGDKVFYYKKDITDFNSSSFIFSGNAIKFYKKDPKTKKKKKLFTYSSKATNAERLLKYLHSKGIKGDIYIPSDDDYYIPYD